MKTPPEAPLPLDELITVDRTPNMRIGEVAARLGLSHRTLRHYEVEGLVIPAERTPGGFRLYSALDVQRFLIIMSMRPLDFSLEEIGRLLAGVEEGMSSDPAERQRGLTVLSEFARQTEERWLALTQKVEIARSFRSYLSAQTRAPIASRPR